MAKKLEIIGQALVITDTSIPKVIFESPKSEVYYDLGLLLNDGIIKINNVDALDNAVVSAPRILLSDSIDGSDIPFTVSSFQSFARTNLGFKTASGGSGAVNSVFSRTGDVTAQSGDYNSSQVGFTPYSTITSTNTQEAIEELKDEVDASVVGAGVGANPLKAVLSASASNYDFGITIPDSHGLYYGAIGGGGLLRLERDVDYLYSGSVVTFLGTITPISENDVLVLQPNVSNESLREILGYGLSASNGVPVNGTAEVDRIVGAFTCTDIRISLRSADTTATVTVDVHKNGVSILDTLVTIDATEKTSVTATTPFVFTASASSISFADDDEIEFIISGTPTDATGLKVKLIGTRN